MVIVDIWSVLAAKKMDLTIGAAGLITVRADPGIQGNDCLAHIVDTPLMDNAGNLIHCREVVHMEPRSNGQPTCTQHRFVYPHGHLKVYILFTIFSQVVEHHFVPYGFDECLL